MRYKRKSTNHRATVTSAHWWFNAKAIWLCFSPHLYHALSAQNHSTHRQICDYNKSSQASNIVCHFIISIAINHRGYTTLNAIFFRTFAIENLSLSPSLYCRCVWLIIIVDVSNMCTNHVSIDRLLCIIFHNIVNIDWYLYWTIAHQSFRTGFNASKRLLALSTRGIWHYQK